MSRKRKICVSKHHIIPRSRGGNSKLENIAKINPRKHQFYHALFDNRTPEEIVNYLVKNYWNGNWQYVENAYHDRNQNL